MTRRKRRNFPSTTTENGVKEPEKDGQQVICLRNMEKRALPVSDGAFFFAKECEKTLAHREYLCYLTSVVSLKT